MGVLLGLRHRRDGLLAGHVGAEAVQIRHARSPGELHQGVLGVGRVTSGVRGGVDGVVELPEAALLGSGDARLGGQGRGRGDLGQVTPLNAQGPVADQVRQLRLDAPGQQGAEGAGEVRVEDHDHRGVLGAAGLAVIGVAVHLLVHERQEPGVGHAGSRGLRGAWSRSLLGGRGR